MNSLFSFDNYRRYLRSYYEYFKKEEGLTFQAFSKRAGIPSANFLKLVIDGKRNLSLESLHQFARALRLNRSEQEYFECLVWHDQAGDRAIKTYYDSRLKALRANRPQSLARISKHELLEQWFYPAILLLANRRPIQDSVSRIAKELRLTESIVSQAISRFLNAKILELEGEVYILRSENLYAKDEKSFSTSHKAFLRSQLRLSSEALERAYSRTGKFYSQTFTGSEKKYSNHLSIIDKALDEILASSEGDEAEGLYQLNIQIFPLREIL
jgi:uncharacterized protein (TIGR02147 family)